MNAALEAINAMGMLTVHTLLAPTAVPAKKGSLETDVRVQDHLSQQLWGEVHDFVLSFPPAIVVIDECNEAINAM